MESQPKIYFACSIRGGREQAYKYPILVDAIKSAGGIVLSEIFANGELTASGSPGDSYSIWKKDMEWIAESDALILEASNPTSGGGYEVNEAEHQRKPVLALYQSINGSKLSAIIDGSPMVEVYNYQDLNLACRAVKEFIGRIQ